MVVAGLWTLPKCLLSFLLCTIHWNYREMWRQSVLKMGFTSPGYRMNVKSLNLTLNIWNLSLLSDWLRLHRIRSNGQEAGGLERSLVPYRDNHQTLTVNHQERETTIDEGLEDCILEGSLDLFTIVHWRFLTAISIIIRTRTKQSTCPPAAKTTKSVFP